MQKEEMLCYKVISFYTHDNVLRVKGYNTETNHIVEDREKYLQFYLIFLNNGSFQLNIFFYCKMLALVI